MKQETKDRIRNGLIANGVKNLKEFGYPNCTAENILADVVYAQFFKSMLESNLGVKDNYDPVIKGLIEEINKTHS